MPYIIAEPCIGVKDKSCVEVCPVDCIYEGETMLYIHPEECIDCGACEPVCPVKAIFAEDETPDQWKSFIELNKQFFKDNPGRPDRSRRATLPRGGARSVWASGHHGGGSRPGRGHADSAAHADSTHANWRYAGWRRTAWSRSGRGRR